MDGLDEFTHRCISSHERPRALIALSMGAILLSAAAGAGAQESDAVRVSALKKLSIAELTEIDVTSVSRSEESLVGAAAAIAVVTAQDIERAGARSVPEALRGLPGIFVGGRNSNSWGIGSRGFSSVAAFTRPSSRACNGTCRTT
jgi:iron complex outermembrane receptor protein